MKLFIASSSADRAWACLLIDLIRARGHEIHDWTSHPGYTDPDCLDPEQISKENLEALTDSDALIWLLSKATSTGAPLEVGYAYALGKPIRVIPVDKPEKENVYPWLFDWSPTFGVALNSLSAEVARQIAASGQKGLISTTLPAR